MVYLAHSQNCEGHRHTLSVHLEAVGTLAAQYASRFNASELARLVGWWHDIGKFNPEFQKYIRNPTTLHGPDHSSAGAIFAIDYMELLAFPIAGHHGGLPDRVDLKTRLQNKRQISSVKVAIQRARSEMPSIVPSSFLSNDYIPRFVKTKLQYEMFNRILFSCLVDADFIDTEMFLASGRADIRNRKYPSISELWHRFQMKHVSGLKQDWINRIRHEVYQHCKKTADMPQGVFRLAVPTGGGKTLSGIAFALKHAMKNNLDRVIVAIPYTSIIDQTVEVYRNIFGDEAVLEHHSGITTDTNEESPDEWQLKARLSSENWDAPIIVTTTVQLFESLFSNRTSRCRKLHNLVGSVIILDEVQMIPERVLAPIMNALEELVNNYHVTVVLCSATQPALEKGPYIDGFSEIRDIIPNATKYFKMLKRVNYQLHIKEEKWNWHKVAEEMQKANQCMAVCNSRKDALALFNTLEDSEAFHLSTLLCGAHRRAVLAKIKHRLASGKPCRLVATQVVEAGVDLDFPVVLRAVGPLDRIVQSAGRCNREGQLTEGQVIVYHPEEEHLPMGAYRTGTHIAMEMLGKNTLALHDANSYKNYFQRLYQAVDTDSEKIQGKREAFMFQDVAEHFHIIEDDTVPAIVHYQDSNNPASVDSLLSQLSNKTGNMRWLMRKLQPYIVNIHRYECTDLQKAGLIAEIIPGLFEWKGAYDHVQGIIQRGLNPEALII